MNILHVVPGLDERWSGIAVAAKTIADGQRKEGHEVALVDAASFSASNLHLADEVHVHSMWTPMVWRACQTVLRAGLPLVRMTHANLDPLRYRYHGWKKRLVAPVERWLFAKTERVVVTGEWEAEWCRQWGLKNDFQVVDLKRSFDFKGERVKGERVKGEWVKGERVKGERVKGEWVKGERVKGEWVKGAGRPLRVLYLGRRHPLKGVGFLERAVGELNEEARARNSHSHLNSSIILRVESTIYGEEKEQAWEWCDVFCLPTLSENFGLVVAEALEHGKPVITTDGAPAWEECASITYLRGYRDGTDAERVKLLKDALIGFLA